MSKESSKEEILSYLRKGGGFVSGEKLSETLSLSRTAIWKQVQNLRHEGYQVEAHSKVGYRLLEVPDLLLPAEVKNGLKTKAFGQEIHHFKEVSSTIDIAKGLSLKGADTGTVVVAEEQKGGRGRQRRKWYSPKGGIWMSIILRPSISPQEAPLLTLAAACALARTIKANLGLEAKIKWPNDVLVSGKKVAGILTEMDAEPDRIIFVILSLGINANIRLDSLPSSILKEITSLERETKIRINRLDFFQALLEELEQVYLKLEEKEFGQVLESWKRLSITLGRQVKARTPTEEITGRAIGIDGTGALQIKLPEGKIRTVAAADMTLI